MNQHVKQYKDFCFDVLRAHEKAPQPAVVGSLMKLHSGMIEASNVKEGDPNFGCVYASLQKESLLVIDAMRKANGAKLPRIPEAIHLLVTALRQPTLVSKFVDLIGKTPSPFLSQQPS